MDTPPSTTKFKVIAPWRGSCVPPTRPPPADTRKPEDYLSLEWVNGVSAKNMRQGVRYVPFVLVKVVVKVVVVMLVLTTVVVKVW